jgi:hypothetical protein
MQAYDQPFQLSIDPPVLRLRDDDFVLEEAHNAALMELTMQLRA